jgi:rhodanese-related sulfurtransferase
MSNKIEPKVVKSWLSDGKEIAFIDIRELGQHTAGHPFFSISIPFSVFEFSLETLVPNKKTRLILMDNDNEISNFVCKKAVSMGYLNVFVIEGGIKSGQKKGLICLTE